MVGVAKCLSELILDQASPRRPPASTPRFKSWRDPTDAMSRGVWCASHQYFKVLNANRHERTNDDRCRSFAFLPHRGPALITSQPFCRVAEKSSCVRRYFIQIGAIIFLPRRFGSWEISRTAISRAIWITTLSPSLEAIRKFFSTF